MWHLSRDFYDLLPQFGPEIPYSAYDLLTWYHIIVVIGCALWVVAYLIFIKAAAKEKTPALPTMAICLNFGWETMYLFLPNPNWVWRVLNFCWFGLDVVLVYQLFLYGPSVQTNAILRDNFHIWVPVTMVASFFTQLSFVITFQDHLGVVDAFFVNTVMSGLFILSALARSDTRGLSIAGAWIKAIGTLLNSIGAIVYVPLMNPHIKHWAFLYTLLVLVTILDFAYIWLLRSATSIKARPPHRPVVRKCAPA